MADTPFCTCHREEASEGVGPVRGGASQGVEPVRGWDQGGVGPARSGASEGGTSDGVGPVREWDQGVWGQRGGAAVWLGAWGPAPILGSCQCLDYQPSSLTPGLSGGRQPGPGVK